MVNVHLKNTKLAERGITILQWAAGVDRATAENALRSAQNNVPVALVMLQAGVGRAAAARALRGSGGHVRQAIAVSKTT
jgi:N-acetylmuramic acid 6-phosphate (MurNAc-6-P) etherase